MCAKCIQVSVWQGIVITLLDGTYSAFLVPISIAFSSDLNHWSWTTIVDIVAGNPACFAVVNEARSPTLRRLPKIGATSAILQVVSMINMCTSTLLQQATLNDLQHSNVCNPITGRSKLHDDLS